MQRQTGAVTANWTSCDTIRVDRRRGQWTGSLGGSPLFSLVKYRFAGPEGGRRECRSAVCAVPSSVSSGQTRRHRVNRWTPEAGISFEDQTVQTFQAAYSNWLGLPYVRAERAQGHVLYTHDIQDFIQPTNFYCTSY